MSLHMFSCFAILALANTNVELCYGSQTSATDCKDGGFMTVPELLNKMKETIDDINAHIRIVVFVDLVFTEEVINKASLEFYAQTDTRHSVTWKFGHAGMDLENYGEIKFNDDIDVIPLVAQGKERLTLYGHDYVFFEWTVKIPPTVKYTVCDIAKLATHGHIGYYNSFDEIISPEATNFYTWPEKDIIFVQRVGFESTIRSISEDCEIEIRESTMIMRNASKKVEVTIKQSSIEENIPFNFEMTSMTMSIYQTSDTTNTKFDIPDAFISTVIYKGSKPITNVESLPAFNQGHDMLFYIETDMPNLVYTPREEYKIRAESVRFEAVEITSDVIINNTATTIIANVMEVSAEFAATKDVIFNVELLNLNIRDNKQKQLQGNIKVNQVINVENAPVLTFTNLEINESCTIIRRYSNSGDLAFNAIHAQKLTTSKSPKLYFYSSRDNLDAFASELRQTNLDTIHDVLCSSSVEGQDPKIDYSIFSMFPDLPDVFSESNSIMDAKYNSTSKCIGIKFNKKILPSIKINIGGTGQNTDIEFNVDSLNSADWNIPDTENLQNLEIVLQNKVEGKLNLDSMNFKSIELSFVEDGHSQIDLDFSQSVADKIKSVTFDAIEITTSSVFSWKCEEIDLSLVTISTAALNNMKFDEVKEIFLSEAQLNDYSAIMDQPGFVIVELPYKSIKFHQSELELNNVKKSYSAKNIMLSLTEHITITNSEPTNINNTLLVTDGINNIIIGSDWTNSPNSHPIAVGLKDVYVDTSLSKVVPISLISFDNSVLNILSTKDKQVNLKHKINILRSFNPDRTSFNLDIRKRISAQNKIEEVIFSDDIIADRSVVLKSDLVAKVKTIQTKPTYFADVAEKLALLKKDPTFPTKSDLEIRKQLFEESAIYGNSMEIEKFVANCFIKIDSDDHLQKINNVEMTVAADTIPPYIEIDTVHANEIQFSFVQVDTVKNRGDLDKMFFGKDIVVGNVKNKKCSDLKGFNVAGEASANDGKITLSVSCMDESTRANNNAVIYARLGEADLENAKGKLTSGQIAGISIGVLTVLAVVVVIVLFVVGVISCKGKNDSSDMNQRGVETV